MSAFVYSQQQQQKTKTQQQKETQLPSIVLIDLNSISL